MAHWAVTLTVEQFDIERLYEHECVSLTEPVTAGASGDQVALVSDGRLVAIGSLVDPARVSYTQRFFDNPPAVEWVAPGRLTAQAFARLSALGPPPMTRKPWMVSLDLPIEAATPAEAVRQFWTYLKELGPQELPAFVWPVGDELAMQAYVLGAEHNLDPEEDD